MESRECFVCYRCRFNVLFQTGGSQVDLWWQPGIMETLLQSASGKNEDDRLARYALKSSGDPYGKKMVFDLRSCFSSSGRRDDFQFVWPRTSESKHAART